MVNRISQRSLSVCIHIGWLLSLPIAEAIGCQSRFEYNYKVARVSSTSIRVIGNQEALSDVDLYASEELTSSDLLLAQTWLAEHGDQHWKLLYNEINGRKYQWVITKTGYNDGGWPNEIWLSFKARNEIDESGTVIGDPTTVPDQFFTLVIDKASYKVKNYYIVE